jgi:rod shape-determining protein MreD
MNRLTVAIAIITVFLMAMVLTWSLPAFPALSFAATLLVFIYSSLKDEEQAAIFGFFVGLLLDMLTQEIPGVNAFVLSIIGVGVSSLRKYIAYESLLWHFLVGILAFSLRSVFILIAHTVIDGNLIITTDLRAFLAAALWTGILGSFYLQLIKRD